jgi:NAD(P)-dependent dehydrogenase (short-subunit alcohol dehydrogenase family)
VRNTDAGDRTAADVTAATDNDAVRVARLDLDDQASVAAFASDWAGPLHVLINNAGVMALPDLQLTPEGWEMQFATNHFGHFAPRSACTMRSKLPGRHGLCRSAPAATSAHG